MPIASPGVSRLNTQPPRDETAPWVHPSAIVDEGATLGPGSRVWHWTHVSAGARIGRDCSFGQNVYVAGTVTIGNNVRIQNNVSVYDGVTIEDDVFCGPSMVFTNVINPRSHVPRKSEYLPTMVRRGATIGANATIVCGVVLGEYAFVAAGSVVTRDVPPYGLVMGVPGRLVGFNCQCGIRLPLSGEDGHSTCPACQRRYRVTPILCEPAALSAEPPGQVT